jgi:UDP-glucuronate 4-epimerase
MALFLFTKNILAGKPIDVFNNGHHKRDFTFVSDIAEGVVRSCYHVATENPGWTGTAPDPATSKAPFRIYNIGNNSPVDLSRYIEVLEACLGQKAERNMLPLQLGDVPDTFADVSDLETAVGYRPSTSVENGVRAFVDWYRHYYRV